MDKHTHKDRCCINEPTLEKKLEIEKDIKLIEERSITIDGTMNIQVVYHICYTDTESNILSDINIANQILNDDFNKNASNFDNGSSVYNFTIPNIQFLPYLPYLKQLKRRRLLRLRRPFRRFRRYNRRVQRINRSRRRFNSRLRRINAQRRRVNVQRRRVNAVRRRINIQRQLQIDNNNNLQTLKDTYTDYVSRAGSTNIQFTYEKYVQTDLGVISSTNLNTLDTQIKINGSPIGAGDENKLHVWVVDFNTNILGYAQFPWDLASHPTTDGVVIDKNTFKQGELYTNYNLGKTLTHEVGHWLGLYHTFQQSFFNQQGIIDTDNDGTIETGENSGDLVIDTPGQLVPTYGNPYTNNKTWPTSTINGQKSYHMFMNFMDYTNDLNTFMFTSEQCIKMNLLANAYRNSHITNLIDIYIIAGQSNAHGYGLVSDLTEEQKTQDAIFYTSWHNSTSNASSEQYYSPDWATQTIAGSTRGDAGESTLDSNRFGIELGFVSKANETSLSENSIGILKYAVGASQLVGGNTSLSDWDLTATGNKEGDCWRGFKQALSDGISKLKSQGYAYNFKGMIWWQGESGNSVSDLQAFILAVRNHLKDNYNVRNSSQFPIVITGTDVNWGSTLEGGVSFPDPYVGFVSSAEYGQVSVNGQFNTHPGSGEQGISSKLTDGINNDMWLIGQAYAEEMKLALQGNTDTAHNYWDPSSLTSKLWLDFDDTTTITTDSSDIVTGGNDKSGNNYSLIKGGSPTLVSNGRNGKNILRLDDNSSYLQLNSISLSAGTRQRWYFVFKPTTVTNSLDAYINMGGGGKQLILMARAGNSTDFKGQWFVTSNVFAGSNLYSQTDIKNTWNIFSVEWDEPNNQFSTWLNGNLISNNIVLSSNNVVSSMTLQIGKYQYYGDSDWGEIFIIDEPTQEESDRIEGYLAHKWNLESNLPSSHPYKSIIPRV